MLGVCMIGQIHLMQLAQWQQLFLSILFILFTQAVGSELIFLGLTITPSAMYSIAVALSTAVVALSSPILGVLADRIAIKKKSCGFTLSQEH